MDSNALAQSHILFFFPLFSNGLPQPIDLASYNLPFLPDNLNEQGLKFFNSMVALPQERSQFFLDLDNCRVVCWTAWAIRIKLVRRFCDWKKEKGWEMFWNGTRVR